MRFRKLLMISALSFALLPASASADWLFTPFFGANFGGAANFGDFNDTEDQVERRMDFGASLGWMGAGVVGWEVDFGYSPNFFQDTNGPGNFEFGDSNVTTLMGNVIVGAPIGGQSGPGFRPYGSAGLGLIRSRITGTTLFNDLSTNDFGVNIGGGFHGFFSDNVGLRGDVRYFRSLQDNQPANGVDLGLSNFDFWRGTVGVTFRW
jgi:opacity protein-like surface antigen